PFGAQDLRVTDFPVLGDPAGAGGAISQPLTFTFDTNDTTGWCWMGGGWWANDGQLRTTPTGGAPGFKALLENATCRDVRLTADHYATGQVGVRMYTTDNDRAIAAFDNVRVTPGSQR